MVDHFLSCRTHLTLRESTSVGYSRDVVALTHSELRFHRAEPLQAKAPHSKPSLLYPLP